MDDLTLGADFPHASRDDWLRLVEGVLKGAAFERTLVARTYDGIAIEPLYAKADERPPLLGATQGGWRIAQRMDHPDPDAANSLALIDLEGGADALCIAFSEARSARGFGLGAHTVDELDRALRGVKLDLIQLRLDAGHDGFAATDRLVALAKRRGHSLSDLDLELGLDPIGALATSGRLPDRWDKVAADAATALSRMCDKGLRGSVFLADGRPYHEAGAGEAQQLAGVLASGVAYLRALERGGHSLAQARRALSFLLVADSDQFLTIAKFRALRRLWARIEGACGVPPAPIRLHAETAWRMMTRRDPWSNVLRTSVAVFSAGIGGADTILALPYTAALGLPDAFARRLARNTHLILLEEASLGRVADPAAGAGGIEALTEALCESAWHLFQEIEREGGIVASFEAGVLQARISAVRSERERAVARREETIVGTSAFSNLTEVPVQVMLPSPLWEARAPETFTFVENSGSARTMSLPAARAAESYERLRDASDAALARQGARPSIFLAKLGAASDFAAPASFAAQLFEAGGFEILGSDGFSSPQAVADAFAAANAKLVCLCSSDQIYETWAAPAAEALQKAGARAIYIVRQPQGLAEQLRDVGVTTFLFAGCDALAILAEAAAITAK